jgi:heme-degrading monooxygenase HmoA
VFARVARYEVDADRTQEAIDAFHDAVAQLEGTPGLEGGYVFVDYDGGAIMSMTLWENRTALDESERKASGLRQDAAKRVDGRIVSVQSLDVAIEIGSGARS